MIDITNNDETFIPSKIVFKVLGGTCRGLHHKIHTVDIVADMMYYNICIVAKNKDGVIIGMVRSVNTSGPSVTIKWHWEMVHHVRYGGSDFTDMINHECVQYYDMLEEEVRAQKVHLQQSVT